MLNLPLQQGRAALLVTVRFLPAALSLVMTACGGGDKADSAVLSVAQPSASAVLAANADFKTEAVSVPGQRQRPLLLATSAASGAHEVRPDVAAFIATLPVTDVQRTALHEGARALQVGLEADLTRPSEVQAAVNYLAHAAVCLRVHFSDSDGIWSGLERQTYNTLSRRIRHGLFLVASRLLAQWPADVTCTDASFPVGSEGGGDPSPAPPPAPPAPAPQPAPAPPPLSEGQQLRDEVARLEREGVLPTLDRGTDIRGPDANNNGVRDDIEAYISSLSISDAQNKAAMQTARNQQAKLLVNPGDKQAVVLLSEQSMAATKCMADVFEGAAIDWSGELSLKIEAITANTPERAKRYLQYMAALSGTSAFYPTDNTCEE